MKDDLARKLAACLKESTTLDYVAINNNLLTADSAKDLAESLAQHKNLRVLDVRSCVVKDAFVFLVQFVYVYEHEEVVIDVVLVFMLLNRQPARKQGCHPIH